MKPFLHRPPWWSPAAGFTLLEVLLAMLLLTMGVGAVVGTSVRTARTVIRARQATRALEAAVSQMDMLRLRASASPPGCPGLTDGADTVNGIIGRRWRLRPIGNLREATVTVVTAIPGGVREDSLVSVLACP